MVRKRTKERIEFHKGGNAQLHKMLFCFRTKIGAFRLQTILREDYVPSTPKWSFVKFTTLVMTVVKFILRDIK